MFRAKWKALISDPNTPWFWTLLAVVVGLPTLGMGLSADDWLQRLLMQERWPPGTHWGPLFEFFHFIPGPSDRRSLMDDMGVVSWWADPEMHGAFFRPVTVATHWLDYQLWPDQIWIQHLHSVLWYAGSVGLVCLLFRRFGLSLPMAGLAGLLFAVEDTHAFALSWLANRNSSICMFFGVGCLLLHRQWRLEKRPIFGVASLGLFLLSLLSAEAGIGTLAYLVAWQWVLDSGSLRRRFWGLFPYLLATLVWRWGYQYGGYGVLWSEVYVDPGRQPIRFGMALLERLPQYMMGQWFQVPIDGYLFLPRWVQWFVVGLCWIGSFAVIRWLWPLVQDREDARFWAWGMGLSLIPICASFPMDRVLTFTGLGAFALLALKVENWISDDATLATMEKMMLILHLPVALMALLIRPWIWLGIWAVMTPEGVMDDLAEDDVFIMLHSHELAGAYISIQALVESDLVAPQRLAMLGPGLTPTEVLRLDERTLEMRPDGGWMPVMASRVTRSTSRPHSVGQVITRPDYQVEILEVTEDGRPLVARFHFQEPLENPRYRWFAYVDGGLTEVGPPAVGQKLSLKSVF